MTIQQQIGLVLSRVSYKPLSIYGQAIHFSYKHTDHEHPSLDLKATNQIRLIRWVPSLIFSVFCCHLRLFYEYQPKFVAKILFLFYPTKHFLQIMLIFIEIYPQIRIFSEFESKKQA